MPNTKQYMIYIAGPYSGTSQYRIIRKVQIVRNIYRAWKVGRELLRLGFFPITPHCNSALMDFMPHSFWLKGDIELMRRAADLVVLIPGWGVSPGAQQEARAAGSFGIPVYYWPRDKKRLEIIAKEGRERYDTKF